MALTKFINGTVADATNVNANFSKCLQLNMLNTIRTLQDRAITFSKANQDVFADAYTSATGRMSYTTSGGNTTATFDTNKYKVSPLNDGTINHDVTFTNESYLFDNNSATEASYSESGSTSASSTHYLGKIFTSRYIDRIYVKASTTITNGNGSLASRTFIVETYNGSSWSTLQTIYSGTGNGAQSFDNYMTVNATIQGIRISASLSSTTGAAYTFAWDYFTLNYSNADSYVEMNIPAGTFPATISNFYASSLIADWETGADIQMKLTNASEDSGYFSIVNMSSLATFTAFTSEPTKAYIKLIPKSSPTAGYPAIYGISVYAN